MKKITFIVSAILFCSGVVSAQSIGAKISKADSKWVNGGIYSGYQPNNEILQKRTANSKHFKNANGSETAQIGGLLHYQDQRGYFQDVDLSITKSSGKYGFSNESNNVKSFFPETSAQGTVKMKVSDAVELTWWKSPKLEFSLNGKTLNTYSMNKISGQTYGNSIMYNNVYPGISEEFETLHSGLENNTIINSMSAEMKALPATALLEFSQVVELGADWKIIVNGKAVSTAFDAPQFAISIPGLAETLSFSKIVVFDNSISKDEALYLVNAPKGKLSAAELARLQQHVYQSNYSAVFVNGGLRITSKLPASWLQKSGRSFPVTVDPTVTIGDITEGNFYGPLTHWYGFQRHADLYLQSEVGGFGNITSIEYYKTGTQAARTKPTKVFMRSIAANVLTGTDAWNSQTYTGGLTPLFDGQTTQDATPGWKMIPLTTSFAYSSGNLLVMVNDTYGGGGQAQYLAQTTTNVTGRQAFKRQDSTDPGDATATAVEARLQTIRITYSSELPVITSFTPAVTCSTTGTVVITGTGFPGATSVTVGGTPVTSFVVNSATQITAIVGSGTTGLIQITNELGTATSATNLTINQSPVVEPILGGATSVCLGQNTAAFTNATAGGTWSVTNGTGSATINASGVLTGVAVGNVAVMYTVSNANCTTVVTTMVAVAGLPPVITISPTAGTVCSGAAQALTVSGSQVIGEVTIGSATTLTSDIEELSAFNNRRNNLTFQMIFTAAELNASGITQGNISSIAFNITSLGSNPSNTNYTIKMGATTLSTMTTQFLTTPMTSVFGPVAYTHAAGWNSFAFTTPYFWDGTSNIVIQVSHMGVNSIYNAETYYTGTATNTVVFQYNVVGNLDLGTVSSKRFNTRFNYEYMLPAVWSPITNLFTDAAGTIPYAASMDLLTVYAAPAAATQYTATIANDAGCTSSASVNVAIGTASATPTGLALQNYTDGQTLADLVVVGDNLQWYSDAAGTMPIPASTVIAEGTYYVSQTPAGQCESDLLAVQTVNVLATVGFTKGNFSYYPNPVSNMLLLKYTKSITSVSVFNLLGQQISSQILNATEGQIDMSKFATGAYLIKVIAENETTTIKIIKN